STYSHAGADNNIIQAQDIRIKQGFLEKSNVNPTEEMVKMMAMFRAYESSQQGLKTIGELTDKMMSGFGLE
ncbi:MAG: flagellar basal body rod C-terminal domain-containing protein, partial [Desulfobacterium sp.]